MASLVLAVMLWQGIRTRITPQNRINYRAINDPINLYVVEPAQRSDTIC